MGTFWASSRAQAYAASLLLVAGLLNACDLNPQPTPPEKLRGADDPGSTSSAASTTGGGIVVQPAGATATSTSGATSGSPIVDGEDDGNVSGEMDPDDAMTSSTTGRDPEGGFSGGGVAGAAGAGTDEALPPPANLPH